MIRNLPLQLKRAQQAGPPSQKGPFKEPPLPRKPNQAEKMFAPPAPPEKNQFTAAMEAPPAGPTTPTAEPPGWWDRNKDWALPTGIGAGGALALGALWYLLRKKRGSNA